MEEKDTIPSKHPPQVDKVLRHILLDQRMQNISRPILTVLIRRVIDEIRTKSAESDPDYALTTISQRVADKAWRLAAGNLGKVLNGTGIILNTNLGRAPMTKQAVEKVSEILSGYSNLELDLEEGDRGERIATVSEQLKTLLDCQAGLTVNNNAASVMLSVAALSKGKEVIVSRGELIEIGGSFRLPDVIESAGGILKEVGTTNRTRLSDYQKAISDRTGMILRCHRSNFAISGFTEETSLRELAALATERGIPLVEDLGSGALIELSALPNLQALSEPTVQSVLQQGADLVMFSGDKLLGGPQCGIVAGKADLVEQLRRHPIYRALRSDKITVAVLEQTLACYILSDPARLLPVLKAATASLDDLKARAHHIIDSLQPGMWRLQLQTVDCSAAFGGGTTPAVTIPSVAITLQIAREKDGAQRSFAGKIASLLRQCSPPVVATVKDERVSIDLRTILPGEDDMLKSALVSVDNRLRSAVDEKSD